MDAALRQKRRELTKLSSEDAAAWIVATFPREQGRIGEAIILIRTRSWKVREQFSLARYYLRGPAYATGSPYDAFAVFMSLKNYIRVFDGWAPATPRDAHLLTYYLGGPLLALAKTQEEQHQVDELLSRLKQMKVS